MTIPNMMRRGTRTYTEMRTKPRLRFTRVCTASRSSAAKQTLGLFCVNASMTESRMPTQPARRGHFVGKDETKESRFAASGVRAGHLQLGADSVRRTGDLLIVVATVAADSVDHRVRRRVVEHIPPWVGARLASVASAIGEAGVVDVVSAARRGTFKLSVAAALTDALIIDGCVHLLTRRVRVPQPEHVANLVHGRAP
eukprot:2301646-Prymnesium_polylepis.1